MKKELNILEVFPEIDWIKDSHIRQATINVWNRLWDECSWEDILTVPCTPKLDFPHVIHNRSVLLNCVAMADTYEKLFHVTVNRDHLISACLLQDASKLVEYEKTEKGVEKSLLGQTSPMLSMPPMLRWMKTCPMRSFRPFWSTRRILPSFQKP